MTRRRPDLAAMLGIALFAAAYVVGVMWRHAVTGVGLPATDVYTAQYPSLVYALRSAARGTARGSGLLWNPYQNCGQPLLPSTLLGLPYPLHVLFLVFAPNTALFVSAAVHLAIGGIGTYWLGRELQLTRVAAFCGGIAFAFGGNAIAIAHWVPTIILGIYVWMPVALLCCERILKHPTRLNTIGLGVVLTVQVLAAYPQLVLFTYQFIALRVLWEFTTRRPAHWRRVLGALAIGGALPVVLGAVQLLPMLEFVRQSIRSGALSINEMKPGTPLTWEAFRQLVATHQEASFGTTFAIVPAVLAGAALATRTHRRLAIFLLFAGALFLALAFENPLTDLYRALPFGRTFRVPARFLYLTGFAFALLAALGVEAVVNASDAASPRPSRTLLPALGSKPGAESDEAHQGGSKQRTLSPTLPRTRIVLLLASILGGLGLYFLSATGLEWWEWLFFAATVSCVCVIAFVPGTGRTHPPTPFSWEEKGAFCPPLFPREGEQGGEFDRPKAPLLALVLLPILLVANLAYVGRSPFAGLLASDAVLYAKRDAFELLQRRMTPQDRIYHFSRSDLSLQAKTPTLFETPAITDYEPQTSRRYAELSVMLTFNVHMETINMFLAQRIIGVPHNRPLLNLLAARYIVADFGNESLQPLRDPPLRRVYHIEKSADDTLPWEGNTLTIYENPAALPRAFYVPRLDVISDARALLDRLASPDHDPRQAALIETAPADGFVGGTDGTGTVDFVQDRPEHLILHVQASADGFVSLSDQDYPGWEARVNGHAAPILRANYAFRAVRVPPGKSVVEFRYRPRSVFVGAALSGVTLVMLVGFIVYARWKDR